jgi:RNA polymerase sigma-70 factor (ECF subfamily)
MSWLPILDALLPPPDPRPIRAVEQEIRDELAFHIEMRTLDNVRAGLSAEQAREDALRRFGNFQRIERTCRRVLLGERIMLQRVQAVLTVLLLGAVVYLAANFYAWQQKQEAATACLLEKLDQVAKQPAAKVPPQFEVIEPAALDKAFPRDAKLTDVQRGFRNWSEATFPAMDAAWWQMLGPQEKAAWEEKWLAQLGSGSEKKRETAIQCLATAGCKKAIPPILKIAAERVEKDNADRCEAVRALGILGDRSLVPELVPLTYHYNMNTRLWAQVSLVRLTGENFGRDVAAWKTWWEKQGGKPPVAEKLVVWATSAWMVSMLHGAEDPKKQEEMDRRFAQQGGGGSDDGRPPHVVGTVPKNGDHNVDPAVTEIRVTYNKKMMDHSWSWCYDPMLFKLHGDPHYEADGRTCVLPVKMEPGKTYTIRLNTEDYSNFRDAAGRPATPYVLQFATRQTAVKGVPGQAAGPQSPALEVPAENVKYAAGGSDDDAKALIARVLKANRPWLEPKPIEASYSLHRDARNANEESGPFSVEKGCKPALRVGSIVWTPLHVLAGKDTHYTVHMLGKLDWKSKNLLAFEVAFDPPVRNEVGLGGQTNTSYSSASWLTAKARIVVEPTTAIPIFIDCWNESRPHPAQKLHAVWAFDADFFAIDGGFAPKKVVWEEAAFLRELQEFQVVNAVWIFKQGDAWFSAKNPSGHSGHIQKMELVNLQIAKR